MNNERFTRILEEITRVDKKVHLNETKYDIDSFAGVIQTARDTRVVNNTLKVDEALRIMLKVTHSFKNLIDDYYNGDSNDDSVDYKKEMDNIINNRISVVKERPWRITSGHLTTLFLQVLYEINGAHYRINDPDYSWEDELDEILRLPNWSYELDSKISQFLLLPLYFATHPQSGDNGMDNK